MPVVNKTMRTYWITKKKIEKMRWSCFIITVSYVFLLTSCKSQNQVMEERVEGKWQMEEMGLSLDGGEKFVRVMSGNDDLLILKKGGVAVSTNGLYEGSADTARWCVFKSDSLKFYDEEIGFIGTPFDTRIEGFETHINTDQIGQKTITKYMYLTKTFNADNEDAMELVGSLVLYSNEISFSVLESAFGNEAPKNIIFLMKYKSMGKDYEN